MIKRTPLNVTLALVVLSLIAVAGCAKSKNPQHSRGRKPPVEAIEACKDKKEGDSVEFKGRGGKTVKAICRECNGQLVAVPDDMPHRGKRPKFQ